MKRRAQSPGFSLGIIARNAARAALMETRWYRTSGATEPPDVRYLRLEYRAVAVLEGGLHVGTRPAAFLVYEATVAGLTGTFAIRAEFGRRGTIVENEDEVSI